MYECSPEYEDWLKNNTEPAPGICAGDVGAQPQWDKPQQLCKKISLGWAVGGDLVIMFLF